MSLFEPQLPPGLVYVPEWLSQLEHDAALQEVDSLPFDESLSRRVQHYGAKYDYSFAKVDERGTHETLTGDANVGGSFLVIKLFELVQ